MSTHNTGFYGEIIIEKLSIPELSANSIPKQFLSSSYIQLSKECSLQTEMDDFSFFCSVLH